MRDSGWVTEACSRTNVIDRSRPISSGVCPLSSSNDPVEFVAEVSDKRPGGITAPLDSGFERIGPRIFASSKAVLGGHLRT